MGVLVLFTRFDQANVAVTTDVIVRSLRERSQVSYLQLSLKKKIGDQELTDKLLLQVATTCWGNFSTNAQKVWQSVHVIIYFPVRHRGVQTFCKGGQIWCVKNVGRPILAGALYL